MEIHQRKILSLREWKDLAAKDEPPKDCLVLVSADIEETKQLDEDGNVFRFVISTENADRDKDVIQASGWRFENYNKNPVVLFGHNYRSLPVASGSPPSVEGGKVLSDADFSASRVDPFAETVRQYVKARVLRASSVGFDPLKWMFNEERRGYDFVEQELLEWSIVPVPANAEALQLAKSLGLDVDPIKQWAIRTLDEWSEEKGIYVPRSMLEKAAKVADSDRVFVLFPKSQLDSLLAGAAATEEQQTEQPPPAETSPASPVHVHEFSVGAGANLTTEKFSGDAAECPICKRLAAAPEKAVDPDDVLVLDIDDGEGETMIEVDPEVLRESIRQALSPLIMERTGRVL